MGLQAKTARVIRDGVEQDIPIEAVVVGDLVRVRPGEKVPVDGVDRRGPLGARREHADRREPAGREGAGRPVIGATLNKTGSFVFRATKVGKRHDAGPDRAAGRGGAGLEGADPAPGRHDLRLLRAGGPGPGGADLRRLARLRAGAALTLRAAGRDRGADHRLPLRARAWRRRPRSWSAPARRPRTAS